VRYTVPDALDVRVGTTYQPMGRTDVELKAVGSDPGRREVTFTLTTKEDNPDDDHAIRARQELVLIEHAPEFLTTNKIKNMGTNGTALDGLINGARDDSDERPDADGDDA
jgi:hypothetical protein